MASGESCSLKHPFASGKITSREQHKRGKRKERSNYAGRRKSGISIWAVALHARMKEVVLRGVFSGCV